MYRLLYIRQGTAHAVYAPGIEDAKIFVGPEVPDRNRMREVQKLELQSNVM